MSRTRGTFASPPDDAAPTQLSLTAALAPDDEDVAPYTVHLPGFDGPLDLLLNLIEKNQMEITSVSLVAVTDQFVAYLRVWDEPPLPRLAAFVAMAARLLLIKSRSLLPRQPRQDADDEDDPLDDAEELAQRLREYQLAREIARSLRARELAGLQSFSRSTRLVDADLMLSWAPPKLVGLNVNALAAVFKRVLTEQRFSQPEQLPLPLVTVAEKIEEVERLLMERGRVTLEEALLTATSRFAVVVTFLAVLEMWHQARLSVKQETLFGAVEIMPGPRSSQRQGATGEAAREEEYAPAVSEFDPAPIAPEPKPRRKRASAQTEEQS
ncbi:MAG: segregation/condensation protein A [Chloroflexota bacterium]|nr:segregation/condensation protein A [Chloroflexota bacterium]